MFCFLFSGSACAQILDENLFAVDNYDYFQVMLKRDDSKLKLLMAFTDPKYRSSIKVKRFLTMCLNRFVEAEPGNDRSEYTKLGHLIYFDILSNREGSLKGTVYENLAKNLPAPINIEPTSLGLAERDQTETYFVRRAIKAYTFDQNYKKQISDVILAKEFLKKIASEINSNQEAAKDKAINMLASEESLRFLEIVVGEDALFLPATEAVRGFQKHLESGYKVTGPFMQEKLIEVQGKIERLLERP